MAGKKLKKNSDKRLKSSYFYKGLNIGYFLLLKNAKRLNLKTAWVTSGAPVEILYSMGIVPFYPENIAAFFGVSKKSEKFIKIAEQHGYDREICSYYKSHIGSLLDKTFIQFPKPDFVLSCNNICKTVVKWYEDLSRRFDVPIIFFDTPFVHGNISEHTVSYIEESLVELINSIEKITGKKFKRNNLIKTLKHSQKALFLWKKIHEINKMVPAPITAFDSFIHMGPIVNFRGTRFASWYYSLLYQEVKLKARKNKNHWEKARILWDNIAIWYNIGKVAKIFKKHGFNVVVDTYSTAWSADSLDPEQPLKSLAKAYLEVYLNQGIDYKFSRIKKFVKEYKIDAVFMHSNRSCKPYSVGQLPLKTMIQNELGLPVVVFESDMLDPEKINLEKLDSGLTTLKEMLDL